VFAIVTQWLGDINRFSTIFNDLSSFMFLRIQILAKFFHIHVNSLLLQGGRKHEVGRGQQANPGCKM
jgi:hypothetical protein